LRRRPGAPRWSLPQYCAGQPERGIAICEPQGLIQLGAGHSSVKGWVVWVGLVLKDAVSLGDQSHKVGPRDSSPISATFVKACSRPKRPETGAGSHLSEGAWNG